MVPGGSGVRQLKSSGCDCPESTIWSQPGEKRYSVSRAFIMNWVVSDPLPSTAAERVTVGMATAAGAVAKVVRTATAPRINARAPFLFNALPPFANAAGASCPGVPEHFYGLDVARPGTQCGCQTPLG